MAAAQFTPVPAGGGVPAALQVRGLDHDIQYGTGISLHTVLSDALVSRNAPVAAHRLASYSSFGGALASFSFTSDSAVLFHALHDVVVDPAQLLAIFAWLTQHGVPEDASLSLPAFWAAAEQAALLWST